MSTGDTAAGRSNSASSVSKATVLLSAQLQNEIKKYLARVEAALFPTGSTSSDSTAASVLRLDGTTPERSIAAYSAAGDIDKLFIIARVCPHTSHNTAHITAP